MKEDKSSKSKAKKGKLAKDPNKPKRPPSAFFVFLYVNISIFCIKRSSLLYFEKHLKITVDSNCGVVTARSSERRSKRKIPM